MASFDAYSVDGDDVHGPNHQPSFDDDDIRSGYDAYSSFPGVGFPGQVVDGGFDSDHVASSLPDPFGFGSSDPNPNLSQFPFGSSARDENGDGNRYGGVENGDVFASGEPVLPPPGDMEHEEGFAMREWRRQNAILLEDKENREKGMRNQILQEAEDYKIAFHEKVKLNVETNKSSNREKEKIFSASLEKFHKEADKQYWNSIVELIPHEVANIQKRGKKEQERKPSVTVVQGPKPGKPTDLSRMRQVLVKLKHSNPPHMMSTTAVRDGKNSKIAKETTTSTPSGDVSSTASKDQLASEPEPALSS